MYDYWHLNKELDFAVGTKSKRRLLCMVELLDVEWWCFVTLASNCNLCLHLEVFGTCPLDTGVPPCRQCRQCLSRYFVLCINKYKIKLHVCCDKCNVFWCFKRLTKKYKLTEDRIIQHSSNIPECCKITVCKDPALSSYPSLSLLWSRWSFLMMPYIFHATSCLPPFNIAVTRKRELTDMESRNNILSLWDSLNQSFSSAPYEGTGYWSIHC